ncbi:Ribonucleoside-diphosphate reductase large subunit [Galdieria sulphuraria]|nr:Ribonucleoside-diphosphate reductase large subunit [Galdieria sulphuraria]
MEKVCSSTFLEESRLTVEEYVTKLRKRLHPDLVKFLLENQDDIQKLWDEEQLFPISNLSASVLVRGYLLRGRFGGQPEETPKQMFFRVAAWLWYPDMEKVTHCYKQLCHGFYIHASPTLLNAGTDSYQLASCFLLTVDDSLESIYDSLKEAATISKFNGGLGVDLSRIRHSEIRDIGMSRGIVPIARLFNDTIRMADQLGNRAGAATLYLPAWHVDVFMFLELPVKNGPVDLRAYDVTLGLWMPDLFYKRCLENGNWSLFCPAKAKGLTEVYGEEFEKLYCQYEEAGVFSSVVKAKDLLLQIARVQLQAGIIRCSNLCTEIVEVCDNSNIASCNLASINLSKLVNEQTVEFQFDLLGSITEELVENLNRVIDRNYYVLNKIEACNLKTRPLGIGVQGFADCIYKLGLGFEDEEVRALNKKIFSCIYYHALKKSCELAVVDGPYQKFQNSPYSQGKFHWEFFEDASPSYPEMESWEQLRSLIKTYGVRNSLLVALMPTASTSLILSNYEGFEPPSGHVISRRVADGRHIVKNPYVVWTDDLIEKSLENDGSLQFAKGMERFKTAFEIHPKVLIDLAADRTPFVDQSSSFSWSINCTPSELADLLVYAWQKKLKTSCYYIHSKPASRPQCFLNSGKRSSSKKCCQ